jgi:hypothetical protein
MASFVVFNGVTRFIPGGITKVNTDALNPVVAGDNSIVALIGEAEGGAPGAVGGIVTLFDDSRVRDEFRAGAIVDHTPIAFSPANDTDIPGGASRVLLYKTNNSTKSGVSLPRDEASQVVASTSTGGSATTLVDTGGPLAAFADDDLNGMWMVFDPFTAATEIRQILDFDGTSKTMTVDAYAGAAVDPYEVLEDQLVLADALAGTSTSTVLDLKSIATMVVDEHAGRTVLIKDAVGVEFKRRVVSNTVSAFTISPALPAASTVGAYVELLANSVDLQSKDWGAHTNGLEIDVVDGTVIPASKVVTVSFEGNDETSPEIGGKAFFKLLYKGGAEAVAGLTADGTSTASVIDLLGGPIAASPAFVGAQVLIDDEYTTITAHTTTQLTLDPPLSAAPDLSGGPVAVSIRTVTAGTMEVSGSSGVATSLATKISGVVGDDLSIAFPAAMTLRDLINTINANANYEASVPNDVNADVAVAADFDFGADTLRTVLNSANLTTDGLYQDTAGLVNYFNTFSELVSATRSTDEPNEGCCPPAAFGVGEEPAKFTGGSRGTTDNTAFQAGLDAIASVRANGVVPLIDQDLANEGFGSSATLASVAAQLQAHVIFARGAGNSERGSFLGVRGAKAGIIAQANALNDFDVQVCGQNVTTINAAGSLQEFGPRAQAVQAAGCRAGVAEVGEPLTHKFVRASSVTQDSSWDPADLTDANEMIQAGILFTETVEGVGIRWVRDLTTHIKDNNLAKSEGSVRDVVRFVAFGLREDLVREFTGKKASPATISSVKDRTVAFLEIQRQGNIIVDSVDPATGAFLRAFHNVRVTSSGDVVRINFGMFPAVGINFILTEIFVQLPTQAA